MKAYKVFLVEDNVLKSLKYNTLKNICETFPTIYKVGFWAIMREEFPYFCYNVLENAKMTCDILRRNLGKEYEVYECNIIESKGMENILDIFSVYNTKPFEDTMTLKKLVDKNICSLEPRGDVIFAKSVFPRFRVY